MSGCETYGAYEILVGNVRVRDYRTVDKHARMGDDNPNLKRASCGSVEVIPHMRATDSGRS